MTFETPLSAVTPQMFGAKGDGKTDDTAAFQKAVDSGYDVFVPTAQRQCYLITRPITITKAQCKRIYSEPFCRRNDSGYIIADFHDAEDPKNICLFDIHIQIMLIGGLRIKSAGVDGHRAGICIHAMDESVCDYDIRIEHCSITNFYHIVDMQGRGLEILSSSLTSSNYLANLYWDDTKDTNKNHPAQYDQRAITIKNCRLHNIASGFLTIKSGHAYGLHFEGNTVDNGRGYLISTADQAYGWNITGNIIQGINGNFDFMHFKKGMRNCVITGNTFISDDGYWVNSSGSVNSWLKCGGIVTASVINSNVFKNTEKNFLIFNNMDGTTIVGNSMYNKSPLVKNAAINIEGNCKRSTIVGNAIATAGNVKLLAKSISKDNSVIGNYPNS